MRNYLRGHSKLHLVRSLFEGAWLEITMDWVGLVIVLLALCGKIFKTLSYLCLKRSFICTGYESCRMKILYKGRIWPNKVLPFALRNKNLAKFYTVGEIYVNMVPTGYNLAKILFKDRGYSMQTKEDWSTLSMSVLIQMSIEIFVGK